jgi:hypothetical protein
MRVDSGLATGSMMSAANKKASPTAWYTAAQAGKDAAPVFG